MKAATKLLYITWNTRYRFKLHATSETRSMAESCIHIAARRHHMNVIAVNVQSGQIHVLVGIPEEMSESKAVGLLKEGSSHDLRHRCSYLPEEDALWCAGYQTRDVPEAEMLKVALEITNQHELHSSMWN